MKYTTEALIQYSYFFLSLFSILVLLDVLIRFKSPLKLKIFFLLIVLAVAVSSFCSFNMTGPDQYIFVLKICKVVAGTAVVQVFTNLYFIKQKKIANIHFITAYIFYIILICYVQIVGYDNVFPKYNTRTSFVDDREFTYHLPLILNFFVYFYFIVFNLFSFYYAYNILFKFSYKNIYFKRVKIWTFCFFIFVTIQIILIFYSALFKAPINIKHIITIGFSIGSLLIVLYRPLFINKNGSKISFGFLFKRNDFSLAIKDVDFNFYFYTSFYFKSKNADITELAAIMGVSKDIMFNYIYFTYSMSFDELVNKARVEYFLEIIKDAKFKNYTVEALALEVGFSSRQRFYQPFKKYHGGNPSDLIDVLNTHKF